MAGPTRLEGLVEALRRLPGVGQKSAQRMAFHLLQHDRDGAQRLSAALADAVTHIGHCQRCHTFTESTLCTTCADGSRDTHLLCVVETPADQAVMERTGSYKGYYYVLVGRISPLDGVGASEAGMAGLMQRAIDGAVQEVIMATSFGAEGEATAYAMGEALKARGLKVTRLARGVPSGSELEYVDLGTLAHALADRR